MFEIVCGDSPTICGQLHPAQTPGRTPDGIEDDREVEVAHSGQVGSAPW